MCNLYEILGLLYFCLVPEGIIIDLRELQLLKAYFPILFTELGIETEVRRLQFMKNQSPILVTELGIVTEVRPWQFLKAPSQITLVPALTT